MTNRIENRVLTTPQPRLLVWSSFGLVGRAVWAADAICAVAVHGYVRVLAGVDRESGSVFLQFI